MPGKDRSAKDLVHRVRGASDIVAAVGDLWTLEGTRRGTRILRHELTRWDECAPSLTLTLDGRLRAQETEHATEDVIFDVLEDAASTGAPRKEIVSACQEAGFGQRATSKQLTCMWKRGRVRKRTEGKEVRYWLTEHAPDDSQHIDQGTTREPTKEP